MTTKLIKGKSSGFIFLEIVISIALISGAFVAFLGIGALVLNVSSSIQKQTQADFLVKEVFEALKNFRDGTTWATNGLGVANTGSSNPYHLVNNAGSWVLTSGVETADYSLTTFAKQVVFDKVSRDPSTQNIEAVYNQSHYDADTRKVTITVSWLGKTIQDVSYFTNWKK